MNQSIVNITPYQEEQIRRLTLIIYILYAVSWFNGVTAIVAIILNYIKRNDAKGTIYESHFTWQIRTFWWGLLWSTVSIILMLILVGFVMYKVLIIWILYRAIYGIVNWFDYKPMKI